MPTSLHAHGKLLLTAEYFVLDGALALAVPTRWGQVLSPPWLVSPPTTPPENREPGTEHRQPTTEHLSTPPSPRLRRTERAPSTLHWRSLDHHGHPWFEGLFELPGFRCTSATDEEVARRLVDLFRSIEAQQPEFWAHFPGGTVETKLEFPREWGLGTSSTLVALLARWSGADPYRLLADTFGGSGYDLACAFAEGPILYERRDGQPQFVHYPFHPPFADQLYFVYLGKKQDSRAGIARYREQVKDRPDLVAEASVLTARFLQAANLADFEQCIRDHEALVGETLALPRAQELYFSDYWGETKSLGAWGGDFVLATSDRGRGETEAYFKKKGMETVVEYQFMSL